MRSKKTKKKQKSKCLSSLLFQFLKGEGPNEKDCDPSSHHSPAGGQSVRQSVSQVKSSQVTLYLIYNIWQLRFPQKVNHNELNSRCLIHFEMIE